MKIAFTTELPKEGFKRLAEKGYELRVMADRDDIISDAEILVSTFDYKVPREIISAMPTCG